MSNETQTQGLKRPSLRAMREIIQARLPSNLKLVLIVLLDHHNDTTGRCCPSITRLMALTGLSKRTVQLSIRKLEEKGLLTIRQRLGSSNQADINFAAIQALELAFYAGDTSTSTCATDAPPPCNTCTQTEEETVYRTEGGTKEASTNLAQTTVPPLLEADNLKTEVPELPSDHVNPTPTHVVGNALQSIAKTIVEMHGNRVQAALLPEVIGLVLQELAQSILAMPNVENLQGSMPAKAVSQILQQAADSIMSKPADPVAVPTVTQLTPQPAAHAADCTVTISPETLTAVNAQRVANGKTALRRVDLLALSREATLAGITPQAAAEWILASPKRSFFLAAYHKPVTAGVVSAPVAPVNEEDRAARAAKAAQMQAELVRRSIESMAAQDQPMKSAIALSGTRTVVMTAAAPIALGEASNVAAQAEKWLRDYAAGLPFKAAQFEHALAITGRSRDEMRALRAAAKAAQAV